METYKLKRRDLLGIEHEHDTQIRKDIVISIQETINNMDTNLYSTPVMFTENGEALIGVIEKFDGVSWLKYHIKIENLK
jgi:hypothetical protein